MKRGQTRTSAAGAVRRIYGVDKVLATTTVLVTLLGALVGLWTQLQQGVLQQPTPSQQSARTTSDPPPPPSAPPRP